MLLRSFRKTLWAFPATFLLLHAASHLWAKVPLITAPPEMGFCDLFEPLLPLILLPSVAFLLYDRHEIEMSLTCGTSTLRLFCTKAAPFFTYTLTSALLVLALANYERYGWQEAQHRIIPLYIPCAYRTLLLFSSAVTVLFFFALYSFFRVATKNCYASLALGLMIYYAFHNLNVSLRGGMADIRYSLLDPFLCNYFIGDTVPSEYYSIGSLWTGNRLLFLGLALLLLTAVFYLLKREKLHQGMND